MAFNNGNSNHIFLFGYDLVCYIETKTNRKQNGSKACPTEIEKYSGLRIVIKNT